MGLWREVRRVVEQVVTSQDQPQLTGPVMKTTSVDGINLSKGTLSFCCHLLY